jgi:hypothetical protein
MNFRRTISVLSIAASLLLGACSLGSLGFEGLLGLGFLSLAQETGETDWSTRSTVTYEEARGDSLYVELEHEDGGRAFLTITEEDERYRVTGVVETDEGVRSIEHVVTAEAASELAAPSTPVECLRDGC